MKEIEIYSYDEATKLFEQYNFLLWSNLKYPNVNFDILVSKIFILKVEEYLEKKPFDIKRLLHHYPQMNGYVVMVSYSIIDNSLHTILQEELLITDLEDQLGYKFESPIYGFTESDLGKLTPFRFLELHEVEKKREYYYADYRSLFGNYGSSSSFYIINGIYITSVEQYYEKNPPNLPIFLRSDFEEIKDKLVEVVSYDTVHVTPNRLLKSRTICLLQDFPVTKIEELYELLHNHRKEYLRRKSDREVEKSMLSTPIDCDSYDVIRLIDSLCISKKNIALKSANYKGHIDIKKSFFSTKYNNSVQMQYIVIHSETMIEQQVTFCELLEIADENSLIMKGTLAFNQYLTAKCLLAQADAFAIFRADKLKAESVS